MLPPQLPDVQAELGCGQDEDAGGHGQEEDSQLSVWLSGHRLQDAHGIVSFVPTEHGEKPKLVAAGTQTQTWSTLVLWAI